MSSERRGVGGRSKQLVALGGLAMLLLATATATAASAVELLASADAGPACDVAADAIVSSSESGSEPASGAPALADGLAAVRAAVGGDPGRFDRAAEAARMQFETGAAIPPLERARARIHLGRSLDLEARARRARATGDQAPPGVLALERDAVAQLREGQGQGERREDPWRSYAWGYQAEIYARQGRTDDALRLADRALARSIESGDADARARWQDLRGGLLRALDRPQAALAAYRASRRAHEEIRSRLDAPTFLVRARGPYTALADLLLLASVAPDADVQALLREAQVVLEDLKSAELRDYFDDPCLAAQVDVDARALPGSLVLYPVLLADRFDLLVGSQAGLERIPIDADPVSVALEVQRFAQRVQDPTGFRFRRSADQIYRWLIAPIADRLGPDTTLVFVPSGPFLQLPVAALRDPETGRFLIEGTPVAVSPGLRLTTPRPIDRRRPRALVAGLSRATGGFEALPSVPDELASVARAFPARRILDEGFTADAFESAFESEPYAIVHIASHGQYSAASQESFLLAWDGPIGLDRFAEIVSQARFRTDRPLDLLGLSACVTARGDERAVLGLAGLAIRSGARSALGTLWSVNDVATARLVDVFYRELAKPGVSRAVALQRAQRALIGEPTYAHPAYWAPFLIVSSWL